jgi:hypothetical protein
VRYLQVLVIKGKVRAKEVNIGMPHKSLQVVNANPIPQTRQREGAPERMRVTVLYTRPLADPFQ